LFSEQFVYKSRFYFYSDKINSENIDKISKFIDGTEEYFSSQFNYLPKESLGIKIMSSLDEMKQIFGVDYFIGGYYNGGQVFLQPVEILLKKNVLQKVVFIEYAHYFIDSYTKNNCPKWLNEMYSAYFYAKFSNRLDNYQTDYKYLITYKKLIDINSNLKNKNNLKEFYNISINFFEFLNLKYGKNFTHEMLTSLRSKKNFEAFVKAKTGKTLEIIFENSFIKQEKSY